MPLFHYKLALPPTGLAWLLCAFCHHQESVWMHIIFRPSEVIFSLNSTVWKCSICRRTHRFCLIKLAYTFHNTKVGEIVEIFWSHAKKYMQIHTSYGSSFVLLFFTIHVKTHIYLHWPEQQQKIAHKKQSTEKENCRKTLQKQSIGRKRTVARDCREKQTNLCCAQKAHESWILH